MVSDTNEGNSSQSKDESQENVSENGLSVYDSEDISLDISVSRKGLLSSGNQGVKKQDGSKVFPDRLKILKFSSEGGIPSPSAKFRHFAEQRDEISRSVPSSVPYSASQRLRKHLSEILHRKIDWSSLWHIGINWLKNPFNMALFLWISCVAISGAILFLVMTGMLNAVLSSKSERNAWFEVNNQILNALFTLMCLYQHPKRFHHLVLLCRWQPKDITMLRKIYCKNGTYKPHEWAHMMVVIVLLHVNCFAQYALCGLNLGYRRSERPAIGVGFCLSVAIAAPAIAGLYSVISPLGKEYDSDFDEEAQNQTLTDAANINTSRRMSFEKRFSFALKNEQKVAESSPEWRGGLFDIWDDIAIAYLSLFCSFCVFGWNMERLGFGNMYVHIATFLLFCTAPFWIFMLAAVNIDNETVREALTITGILLCLFGLLYGGFWRIRMRKRFNLPANSICCGKPAIADCTQWLFCCWCSLAQEVRTADFYDIVEDKFCRKETEKAKQPTLSPLPREDGVVQFKSNPNSPFQSSPRLSSLGTEYSPSPSRFSKDYKSPDRLLPRLEEEFTAENYMKPPAISSMERR